MRKRSIMSLLLAFCLCFSMITPVMAANNNTDNSIENNKEMSELDLVLAAYTFMASNDQEQNLWPVGFCYVSTLPLYDLDNNIVAYYVKLLSGGYAVVNNNIDNPSVIEFGDDSNLLIEEILSSNSNPHIIYNDPFNIYDLNLDQPLAITNEDVISFYDYYPNMNEKNEQLANLHSEQRKLIAELPMLYRSDDDYGFIYESNLPSGSCLIGNIPFLRGIDWATTGEFSDIAKNHCGAVAVTNLALYFAHIGYSNLEVENSVRKTFASVQVYVPNGPVMTIADKAKKYFNWRGYTLNYSTIYNFDDIMEAINAERPCGILLENSLADWHWVIGVGYRQYYSGSNYIRIINGWNDSDKYYYMPHNGSTLMSATQYWI